VLFEVKDPHLQSILGAVKKYWKDTFRPALTSFSCEAVGGTLEMASDASLMFTLASAGFGIHDDILDKSTHKHLRRTILGLYGTNGALLAGDLLIVKAWTTIHQMIRRTCKPTQIADVVDTYGKLSVEICEGEFIETLCRRRLDIDIEYYMNFLWKAMAEMEACSKIGAIIGGGQDFEVEALGEFGRKLGLISRLGDDAEDCLNLKGTLLPRIKNESVPLPLLYAAKSSSKRFEKIQGIIKKSKVTSLDAKSLLQFCFEAEAFRYTCNIAEKNKADASQKLRLLKDSTARKMLSLMLERSYDRVTATCI
jgi:geranylgeranyl pyrophosphate synthase